MSRLFTSESVTEGHPDKVCDYIADSILDAYLHEDPNSRVACEVLCKDDHVILAGEITSQSHVDRVGIVRSAISQIGYTYADCKFHAAKVKITDLIGSQSECLSGVDRREDLLGAGDQGIVFGFATRETPELLPLPLVLAHAITKTLASHRHSGYAGFLRPDAKSQVTVRYKDGCPAEVVAVVVSAQHEPSVSQSLIHEYARGSLLPEALGHWLTKGTKIIINPAGPFSKGGPEADCGLTGRKIVVDTYGGAVPHGGGAFSGKDGSKVDRSSAYFARYVARQIVLRGLGQCAEVQVAYAIGQADPISLSVNTRNTGDDALALEFAHRFDFRPGPIIRRLGLDRPIFSQTTNYGHFGRNNLPWEQ